MAWRAPSLLLTAAGADDATAIRRLRNTPFAKEIERPSAERSPRGRERAAPGARLRNGQPQMVAQGLPLVLLAEQPAALKLRHDETHEVLVSAGNVGSGNHEAVARALDHPLFELVRHLLRAADDRIVNPAAAAEVKKLAHRRVSIPAGAHHAVADGLKTGHRRHLLVRERLVHPFGREIEVERLRQ